MILLGIALVFLFQALLSLMQYSASTEAQLQIVFWTMGSQQRANGRSNLIIAGAVAAQQLQLHRIEREQVWVAALERSRLALISSSSRRPFRSR